MTPYAIDYISKDLLDSYSEKKYFDNLSPCANCNKYVAVKSYHLWDGSWLICEAVQFHSCYIFIFICIIIFYAKGTNHTMVVAYTNDISITHFVKNAERRLTRKTRKQFNTAATNEISRNIPVPNQINLLIPSPVTMHNCLSLLRYESS